MTVISLLQIAQLLCFLLGEHKNRSLNKTIKEIRKMILDFLFFFVENLTLGK